MEMAWDPITRIVGSLGIYTKIDFGKGKVAECHSTSSIFRGYSIFMKGKDPRDAHFITSRICGICGDNHATCSCYAQNMAYGVHPPALGEQIVNLGEAAEYMFDHNIFQENLVGVDFCEKMVAETNPGVLERANRTESPHADAHGYKTIGDIMRSLNPFSGEFYREALQVSRYTREMFCLMEGRHVHPSTLYPGGVGTTATIQLFTDYYIRLMRYVEFMKRVVPMHDDLFDFFYQAMPGYEEVGKRRILLGCWGAFQDPAVCNFDYRDMTKWGRAMGVTPGVVVDGKLVTNDLVDINLGIRILLGHSFYDDWEDQEMFVTHDPLGNPVDRRHPWNQHTNPQPQKRDFDGNYSWVMCAALVRRQRPPRSGHRRRTAGPAVVDRSVGPRRHGPSEGHRYERRDPPPEDGAQARGRPSSGRSRNGPTPSSATGPAPTSRRTPPLPPSTSSRRRSRMCEQATPRPGSRSRFPTRGSAAGSPRPCVACCRTTWSSRAARSPTTTRTRRRRGTPTLATAYGTPGPVRGRGHRLSDLRGERPGAFQGHRHHAVGAQLRPVPALRGAHVPGQGQGA